MKTILLILSFVVLTSCGLDVEQIDSYQTTESLCADDLNLSKNVISDVSNVEFNDAEIVSNEIVMGDSVLNGQLVAFNRYVSDDGDEQDALFIGFTKQIGTKNDYVLQVSLNFDSYDVESIAVGETINFDKGSQGSFYPSGYDFSFDDLVDCTYRGEYTSPFSLTNYCGDYFAEQPNDYSLYENDVTVTRLTETDYSVEDEFFIRDWSVVNDPHGPEGFVARFVLRYDFSKENLNIIADRPELTKSCDVKVYAFEYMPDLSGPDVCPEGYFNANGVSTEPYSDYTNEEEHVAVKACAKCVITDENGNMVLDGEDAVRAGVFAYSTDELCKPKESNNDVLVDVLE